MRFVAIVEAEFRRELRVVVLADQAVAADVVHQQFVLPNPIDHLAGDRFAEADCECPGNGLVRRGTTAALAVAGLLRDDLAIPTRQHTRRGNAAFAEHDRASAALGRCLQRVVADCVPLDQDRVDVRARDTADGRADREARFVTLRGRRAVRSDAGDDGTDDAADDGKCLTTHYRTPLR